MEIVKQDLTVKTGSVDIRWHLARPASGGPYPSIVVVMEPFGPNGQRRFHCTIRPQSL
jgi:dienelactone hydrolase